MARKTNKQKAQELVDAAGRLYDNAIPTPKKLKAWAKSTLPKMDEAINLDPDNAGAWLIRGIANGESGNHQDAIDDCNKAIRLDPEDSRAWFHRGVAKIHLKDMGGYDDMRKAEKLHSPEPPKPKPTLNDAFDNASAFEQFILGMAFILCFIGLLCAGEWLVLFFS